MNHFQRKGAEIHCEDVPLSRIAAEVGTPVYVYSAATLERHFRVFDEALAGLDHLICYSVKANSNLSILRLLFGLGAGADIVSGGELFRALKAGCPASKIVFSGVGKTDDEMRAGLEAGVKAFNVESLAELDALDAVARALGKRARVLLRVNPDVDAETHPYISTGLKNNKFGISADQARAAFKKAGGLPGIELTGVDFHIGSQLTKTTPFADAITRLVALIESLQKDGVAVRSIDIGGGLGIPYGKDAEAPPPSPAEYGAAIRAALAPLAAMKLELVCEPGRVIVGNAGALVTRVVFNKDNEGKRFVIVDAAMNDLMRPSLYGAYHPMQPVVDAGRPVAVADVVGPICETGDFLARDRELPALERGELLMIGASGAYGFTMSSNYNTRPRAAEVLVEGGGYRVVRRRETLEQLIANEL
jgi:diaminopimelate decarboxylase